MRYCTANGILLCNQTFHPRNFDCIWSLSYDGSRWNQQWIYEESLEHIKVIGYRGGATAHIEEIAQLLCSRKQETNEMKRKCEEDAAYFATCHNKAKVVDISKEETLAWKDQTIRRCHACVNVCPAKSAACLWCNAEWLCRDDSAAGTSSEMDIDDDEEPTASGATGSASKTVVPPEAKPKSETPSTANTFPTAEGVKWDIEKTTWGDQVWPTKRRGSIVAGESVALESSFLDFSEQRSCGNHQLVNSILSMTISLVHLKTMAWRWKMCGVPAIAPFVSFLEKRVTEDNRTLLSLFHEPKQYANGWYSFEWVAYKESELSSKTLCPGWERTDSDWTPSWHGTKIETIYKTCVDGCLNDSTNDPGRRILDGRPGVYMMSDTKKDKAINYARPVCLNDDGVGYRALWQVMTDRTDKRSSGNDQWIAPQRSVKLVALWVRVELYNDMVVGDDLQLCCDDAMEIPPDF